jgi:hypothetical protein
MTLAENSEGESQMTTIFPSGGAAPALYRVMMLKGGKWQPWTNYESYEEAELAARGLITGGTATRDHILEIGKDGGRIVAEVGAVKKLGWPRGKAEVRKV